MPTLPRHRWLQRSAARLLVVGLALTACASGPAGAAPRPPGPPPEECTVARSPDVPEDDGLQAVHARARALGAAHGRRAAAAYVADRTTDGYRLRGLVSTLAMGLGLFLVGALFGTLILSLLGRRPIVRYARRVGAAATKEIEALEALVARDPRLAPLEAPLETAKARIRRLVDLATPLETAREADLAASRRGELYRSLEALLAHLEGLHLRALGWLDEGSPTPAEAGGPNIDAAEEPAEVHTSLDAEVKAAAEALTALLSEDEA